MDIDEVFNPQAGLTPPPVAFAATINSDAAGVNDGINVIIEAFDPNRAKFGPLPWPSRSDAGGPVLPTVGDRALVMFDNNHEAWVIAWWPYA